MLGLDARGCSTEEEVLQALVPKIQDRHKRSVTRNVSGSNRLIVASVGPDSLFLPAHNHGSRYCEITTVPFASLRASAHPLPRNDPAGDLMTVENCVLVDDSGEWHT